jgi:hypothetical protein
MLKTDNIYYIHSKNDTSNIYKIKVKSISNLDMEFELIEGTLSYDNITNISGNIYKCSLELFNTTFNIDNNLKIAITKKKSNNINPLKYIEKMRSKKQKSMEDEHYNKLCSNASYYCCYLCNNTFYQNHHRNFRRIIDVLNLTRYQKIIIYDRYLRIVEYYFCSKRCYDFLYYLMKFLIQSCSIVVPALLSIEYFFSDDAVFIDNSNESFEAIYNDITDENIDNPIFWIVWGISLLVGLLTNIMGLFSIDSKFFTTGQTYLKMVSEGWQYFELTGKYGVQEDRKNDITIINTHKTQFNNFCNEIEKIYKNETELRYVAPIASDNASKSNLLDDSSDDDSD